jgi:hypothetical protein
VLNSEEYYRSVDRSNVNWDRFDPEAVKMIIKLVEEFTAKIVISSTWRFGAVQLLDKELKKSGFRKYLHKEWKTPQDDTNHRGTEIKMWLDKQADVRNYLILDDDTNILEEQIPNFVQTNLRFGMEAEHYYKAREILENK